MHWSHLSFQCSLGIFIIKYFPSTTYSYYWMPRFTAMLFTSQLFLYWRWSSQHCFLHYVFILNQFSRQIGSKFPRLFFVFVLKPYHVIFRLKWRTTRFSKKCQVGQKEIKKKFQKVIHLERKILHLEILLHIYKSFSFWVI